MKRKSTGRSILLLSFITFAASCQQPSETATHSTLGVIQRELGLGSTWERPVDGMTMVFVPGGEAQIGNGSEEIGLAFTLSERHPDSFGKCASKDFEDETPWHTQKVADFWIDQAEVTNAQYSKCV